MERTSDVETNPAAGSADLSSGGKHESHALVQAAIINNGAISRAVQGELEEALKKFEEAIEMQRGSGRDDNLDVAACLINVGNVYSRLGNQAQALQKYRDAVEMQKRIPDSGADQAAAYQNIGLVYETEGQLSDALQAYEVALMLREEQLGQHEDTVRSLNDMADVLEAIGDQNNGENYRNRATQMKMVLLQRTAGLHQAPAMAPIQNPTGPSDSHPEIVPGSAAPTK